MPTRDSSTPLDDISYSESAFDHMKKKAQKEMAPKRTTQWPSAGSSYAAGPQAKPVHTIPRKPLPPNARPMFFGNDLTSKPLSPAAAAARAATGGKGSLQRHASTASSVMTIHNPNVADAYEALSGTRLPAHKRPTRQETATIPEDELSQPEYEPPAPFPEVDQNVMHGGRQTGGDSFVAQYQDPDNTCWKKAYDQPGKPWVAVKPVLRSTMRTRADSYETSKSVSSTFEKLVRSNTAESFKKAGKAVGRGLSRAGSGLSRAAKKGVEMGFANLAKADEDARVAREKREFARIERNEQVQAAFEQKQQYEQKRHAETADMSQTVLKAQHDAEKAQLEHDRAVRKAMKDNRQKKKEQDKADAEARADAPPAPPIPDDEGKQISPTTPKSNHSGKTGSSKESDYSIFAGQRDKHAHIKRELVAEKEASIVKEDYYAKHRRQQSGSGKIINKALDVITRPRRGTVESFFGDAAPVGAMDPCSRCGREGITLSNGICIYCPKY